MTDKEAMKLALFALDIVKMHYTQSRHINEAIVALKERLADHAMSEVQRLGQEIEQEPICPKCKAKVLYECVACSSNNYPPPQPQPEPVAWLCAPDENGLFGLPLSDKGCIDCFPVYRHPPQRTEQEHMTPWSQKTIEQKIEASVRHYTKEIERAKEVGDPHQFVGTYEGFVVCLESILEKTA
jgi:hypothetical protein